MATSGAQVAPPVKDGPSFQPAQDPDLQNTQSAVSAWGRQISLAIRTLQAAPAATSTAAATTAAAATTTETSTPGAPGSNGTNGWTPILALVASGPGTTVIQVTGWTGGSGTVPASGMYVGSAGFVTNIASAVNVQGPSGVPGSIGGFTLQLNFSSTTSAPPASGFVEFDNATFGSIANMFVSDTDLNSNTITGVLAAISSGSLLMVFSQLTNSIFAIFKVTSAAAGSGYYTFGVTPLSGQIPANLTQCGIGIAGGGGGSTITPPSAVPMYVDCLVSTPGWAANNLNKGQTYVITTVGTTNWVALGAASNTLGVVFTYNGVAGTGTGVARTYCLRDIAAPTQNTYCFVASFANGVGDGGGGWFQFVQSDNYNFDDGGTIIVPGGSSPVLNTQGLCVTPGTASTVGSWHRIFSNTTGNNDNASVLNVQWFGAGRNAPGGDSTPYIVLASNALAEQFNGNGTNVPGTLYFPADTYNLVTKCVLDMWGSNIFTLKGDGDGGSILQYAMVAPDTCMMEIRNGVGGGSMQDFRLQSGLTAGLYLNPSMLWIHDTLNFSVINVKGYACYANGAIANGQYGITGLFPGGVFKMGGRANRGAWVSGTQYYVGDIVSNAPGYICWTATNGTTPPGSDTAHWRYCNNSGQNTSLLMLGCYSEASWGTQLYWDGASSGQIAECKFKNQQLGAGSTAWASTTVYNPGNMALYTDGNTYMCRTAIGPWVTLSSYVAGNYVTYSGTLYECILAVSGSSTPPPSDATHWSSISSAAPSTDTYHWQMIAVNAPCSVMNGDTVQMHNVFFQNGGPWCAFNGAALTSLSGGGLKITVASGTQPFVAGDWILLTGATNTAYNGLYQITSVDSSGHTWVGLDGQTLLGTTTYASNDTVTLSSLWSCLYAPLWRESQASGLFFNTGAVPFPTTGAATGTVACFLDGFGSWSGATVGGLQLSHLYCDYGGCQVFVHGNTSNAGSPVQYNSSAAGVRIDDVFGVCADKFGGIRIEGAVGIQVKNPTITPGAPTSGTGETDSIVISDGGTLQVGRTEDISIVAGSLSSKLTTAQHSGMTICAVTIDGAGVYDVSVNMPLVDAAQTVMQLVNRSGTGSPSLANGITMLYANNAGRLTLIDSTRAIPGGNL